MAYTKNPTHDGNAEVHDAVEYVIDLLEGTEASVGATEATLGTLALESTLSTIEPGLTIEAVNINVAATAYGTLGHTEASIARLHSLVITVDTDATVVTIGYASDAAGAGFDVVMTLTFPLKGSGVVLPPLDKLAAYAVSTGALPYLLLYSAVGTTTGSARVSVT